MSKMENFIAVQENTADIIGKFLYYSTSNILINRAKFIEIGQSFGLPKYKPARESKAGAYRNATTAIKDRIQVKDGNGTQVYRIYCRDNKKEDATHIYRELVKETITRSLPTSFLTRRRKPFIATTKRMTPMWMCGNTAVGRWNCMTGSVPVIPPIM